MQSGSQFVCVSSLKNINCTYGDVGKWMKTVFPFAICCLMQKNYETKNQIVTQWHYNDSNTTYACVRVCACDHDADLTDCGIATDDVSLIEPFRMSLQCKFSIHCTSAHHYALQL